MTTISDDLVRQLASRREGTTLDFKENFHANSADGSAELAKDLMAIANSLRRDDEYGYILIGVAEDPAYRTGIIKGFTLEEWITDSNLHQKVSGLLNRVPNFSWSQVNVDGRMVGVIEIRPGGRPYFPLKDINKLKRYLAHHRIGSATDFASPDEIVRWAREDDKQKVNELELEKRETELVVLPRLRPSGGSISGGVKRQTYQLFNDGKASFKPTSAQCIWTLNTTEWRQWLQDNHVRFLGNMPPYVQEVRVPDEMVMEGRFVEIKLVSKKEDLEQHFSRHLRATVEGIPPAIPPYINFLVAEIEVSCQGLSKTRTAVAKDIFYWDYRNPDKQTI